MIFAVLRIRHYFSFSHFCMQFAILPKILLMVLTSFSMNFALVNWLYLLTRLRSFAILGSGSLMVPSLNLFSSATKLTTSSTMPAKFRYAANLSEPLRVALFSAVLRRILAVAQKD